MTGHFVGNGKCLEQFTIINGIKQGFAFSPTLFGIVLYSWYSVHVETKTMESIFK